MNYKRATKIYQDNNISTIPIIEYVLLLLKEVLKNVQLYDEMFDLEDDFSRNKVVSKAQDLLFELMATTDRNSVEGERLLSFYAHLNQCLVELRIAENSNLQTHVKLQLEELIDSWEEAKQTSRLQKYRTPWI